MTLVTPVWPQAGTKARAAYEAAQERLADAVSDFERTLPLPREGADAHEGPNAGESGGRGTRQETGRCEIAGRLPATLSDNRWRR